jgi:hypothetical protein
MARDHVDLINMGKYVNFCAANYHENNIKTDLSDLGCESVDCIQLA